MVTEILIVLMCAVFIIKMMHDAMTIKGLRRDVRLWKEFVDIQQIAINSMNKKIEEKTCKEKSKKSRS